MSMLARSISVEASVVISSIGLPILPEWTVSFPLSKTIVISVSASSAVIQIVPSSLLKSFILSGLSFRFVFIMSASMEAMPGSTSGASSILGSLMLPPGHCSFLEGLVRSLQHFHYLVGFEDKRRVVDYRAVGQRELGDLDQPFLRHSRFAQLLRDTELLGKREDRVYRRLSRLHVAHALYVQAHHPRDERVAVGGLLQVELHAVRKHDAVGEPVRHLEKPAERMRERVRQAHLRVIERDSRHGSPALLLSPREQVAAVLDALREVLVDQPDGLESHRVGDGRRLECMYRFYPVRERVHARGRRQTLRKPGHYRRVEYPYVRDHVGV